MFCWRIYRTLDYVARLNVHGARVLFYTGAARQALVPIFLRTRLVSRSGHWALVVTSAYQPTFLRPARGLSADGMFSAKYVGMKSK